MTIDHVTKIYYVVRDFIDDEPAIPDVVFESDSFQDCYDYMKNYGGSLCRKLDNAYLHQGSWYDWDTHSLRS